MAARAGVATIAAPDAKLTGLINAPIRRLLFFILPLGMMSVIHQVSLIILSAAYASVACDLTYTCILYCEIYTFNRCIDRINWNHCYWEVFILVLICTYISSAFCDSKFHI